jgi:putative heme-binding domain-containing protein
VLVRCESEGGPAGFSVCVPEPGTGPLWKEEIQESDPTLYLEYALKHDGNPARGFEVFSDPKRGSCVKCHAVAGKGGAVGPDLGGIGKQYDRAGLAENVLFPGKVVRPDYRQFVVILHSGEVKTGLVRGETADELTLIDADGARHAIKKSEVATREPSPLSLMPEGLSTGMSLDDFTDLLTYLESLRSGSPNK